MLDDLFCETSFRKKIIKKIFSKDEEYFNSEVNKILDKSSWSEAVQILDELFTKRKVNMYSEEAVKLVDIFEGHFNKTVTNNKAV